MKINVSPSKEFDCVELHFSDGQCVQIDFDNANRLKEGIARGISLAMTKGENDGGWGPNVANVECSEMIKEF